MLMNARARREAVAYMDAGDFQASRQVLSSSIVSSQRLCMAMGADAEMSEELASLEELSDSLTDRDKDAMSRKQLSYRAYDLSRSRRSR